MDLSINDLVARGRLAAEACAWELTLDGCLTRPPTPADLVALGETRSRTDAEARALLAGLFAAEVPAGIEGWGVEQATAVLSAYVVYFKEWQAKKQAASASGVAGAVREALQREGGQAARTSPGKPG